jgi:hypothetical protein
MDILGVINESNPRYKDWVYIMGTEHPHVKLKSGVPQQSNFGEVYLGDVAALTKEQKERLIERMSQNFHVPKAQIEQDLKDGKFPLKPDSVIYPLVFFT